MNLMKTLNEILIEPELPEEIRQGLADLERLFNANTVLARLDELAEEAATAPLASRFSPTRIAGGQLGPRENSSYLLKGSTEETYKRLQLQIELVKLQHEFIGLCSKAQSIFLDLQMAKRE